MKSPSATSTSARLANLAGIITIISWGSLGLLGKAISSLPPLFVLAISFWGAFLIGLALLLLKRKANPVKPAISKTEIGIAAILLFSYHYLYFASFHYAPAIEVSLINYLWPAFVILLGNCFFALQSGIRGICGALLGFCGIFVLFSTETASFAESQSRFGLILALSGAILWALYSNIRRTASGNILISVTYICGLTALSASVFSLLTEELIIPNAQQSLLLALLIIGPAGGAFFLWDLAMKRGNAATLAVLGYSAPVISTALLIIAGYAELSVHILLATMLIAIGGLVTYKKQ